MMNPCELYNKCIDSVVNVGAIMPSHSDVYANSSGVVIGDGSRVLTCNHSLPIDGDLFRYGIYKIDKDGSIRLVFGEVIGRNIELDYAIMSFPMKVGSPAEMGDFGKSKIGDDIFTIGFPLNAHYPNLAKGYISAIFHDNEFAINGDFNQGNSGGGIFNNTGELIGIYNKSLGSVPDKLKTQLKDLEVIFKSDNELLKIASSINDLYFELEKYISVGIGYGCKINYIINK